MATFPSLKTNAVAQYPATRTKRFKNVILQFLDGSDQRYRDSAGPLVEWHIRLNGLDEGELAAIQNFFTLNQGSFADFEFIDPWDSTVYPNCSRRDENLAVSIMDEMRAKATIIIVQNPV